jgi:hypothetical protein
MGGYALGVQQAEQDRARDFAQKQFLSDEEIQNKAQQYATQISDLRNKASQLPKDSPEWAATNDALVKTLGDVRELYHPDRHPQAISKFGHLITNALHITKPEVAPSVTTQSTPISVGGTQVVPAGTATTVKGPTPSEAKQYPKTIGADIQQAKNIEAAAPLTPEQQAQIASAKMFENIQGELQNYDRLNPHAAGPDATPEEKQARQQFRDEVIRKATGLGGKPVYKTYMLPDKTYRSYDVSRPDLIPAGATEVLPGSQSADAKKRADYEQAKTDWESKHPGQTFPQSYEQWTAAQSQKPSVSAINEFAASYAKLHGISMTDLTPADWDYLQRKSALDKAIPTATTSTAPKQNLDGQWVEITVTNYKTPGGNIQLEDPRGTPIQPPPGSRGGSPSEKATPQQLKKEAESRRPKASGGGPRVAGNVSVSAPLFAAPNKQYNDTKVAYQSAVDRTKIMEKNLANAINHHDQQAMLSLVANHIGMTLGAQKGARINQAVWNEAVESTPWMKRVQAKFGPDGYLSGVTLAPEQMRQMVELAKERTAIIKQSLDDQKKALNQGVQYPSSGTSSSPPSTDDKDIDAIIQALNATKK